MAKVTWLGEDVGDSPGPSFVMWQGMKFPKGKAVEVSDENVLARARGNRFFKVTDGAKAPAKEADAKPTQTETTGKAEGQGQAKAEAQEPEPPKNVSGYSPAKKRVRKPKAKAADKHAHG